MHLLGACTMPEPLVAYRFHDANTVWFREGGRSGYVLEVNRVVATVLRRYADRAVRDGGPQAATERLAELLRTDVAAHGETDGLAMFLTEIMRSMS